MRLHLGTLLLSAIIAMVLWGMSHGTSSIERSYDIPVVFDGVPEDLVITGSSVDAVNIRIQGSRAALRNVSPNRLEYHLDLSEARQGPAVYEVDPSSVDQDLPRGARIVSRSPASIDVALEQKGRKSLRIRADVEGEPAEGFQIASVQVEPSHVWVTGARSHVLRLTEVVTEAIQVAGLNESVEREVRLSLGSDNVWREEAGEVIVRIEVAPLPEGEGEDGKAQG
ncbi:MAG: CdaR family protein [Myxococcota bacterium]